MTEIVAYGPLPDQFGELTLPAGCSDTPLIILIHGGFWRDQYRLDLMHDLAADLNAHAYATWNIEYRRVGRSGGGFPGTLDDVAAAVDYFADREWDRIAVIGHSAGGHLALWNASRATAALRANLTIALAPVADVIQANRNGVGVDATRNFFDGDYANARERYEYAQPDADQFVGRVILLHGDRDESVPLEQSTNFARPG